jgi:phage tail-like protein
MAATDDPGYPFTAFNFEVKIDGGVEGGFSECSGLTTESDVIEYRTGADDHTVRKLPGLKKFANIVLKRGFMKNDAAWKWRKMVLDGKTGDSGGRRSGSITLLGEDKKPVLQWDFYAAWPSKPSNWSSNGWSSRRSDAVGVGDSLRESQR